MKTKGAELYKPVRRNEWNLFRLTSTAGEWMMERFSLLSLNIRSSCLWDVLNDSGQRDNKYARGEVQSSSSILYWITRICLFMTRPLVHRSIRGCSLNPMNIQLYILYWTTVRMCLSFYWSILPWTLLYFSFIFIEWFVPVDSFAANQIHCHTQLRCEKNKSFPQLVQYSSFIQRDSVSRQHFLHKSIYPLNSACCRFRCVWLTRPKEHQR